MVLNKEGDDLLNDTEKILSRFLSFDSFVVFSGDVSRKMQEVLVTPVCEV